MSDKNSKGAIVMGYKREASDALNNLRDGVIFLCFGTDGLPSDADLTQIKLRAEHAERMVSEYRRAARLAA